MQRIQNRAGFKELDRCGNVAEYLILPEIFKTEVCRSFDSRRVAKVLDERGFLEVDTSGKKRVRSVRRDLPELGRKRVYALKPGILLSDED
jgi:putative DNA primase/helicase